MKVLRTIATGVLLGSFCPSSWAVAPSVERPTPPPCCADGQCFASPASFGYYDTRWRRWPLEALAQNAAQKPTTPSTQLQNDVGPFVVPSPEREGDKAPPPSTPVGEQTPAGAAGSAQRNPGAPGGAAPPTGTGTGTGAPNSSTRGGTGYPAPNFPTPPTNPGAPPAGPATPSTQPLYKSVSPDSPLNRSGSGPMGDADPPPSLPFGPALVAPEQPMRDVSQQPAAIPRQAPTTRPADAPSNDPPPAPPIALASYTE